MPRGPRVVIPGEPHHVIQRGNRRQTTFFSAKDYAAYVDIAAEAFGQAGVEVWAYCLMPNHVHMIATPRAEGSLAAAMQTTHIRYTHMINRREDWTGCLWQGRYASYAMDEDYLMRCVRYVGLNPVRGGLVKRAVDWPWSSVRAHVDGRPARLLTRAPIAERLGQHVADFFEADCDACEIGELRDAAVSGRPLGTDRWIRALEVATGRRLAAPGRGRPARTERGQALFS